jgi:hypothetical protein
MLGGWEVGRMKGVCELFLYTERRESGEKKRKMRMKRMVSSCVSENGNGNGNHRTVLV